MKLNSIFSSNMVFAKGKPIKVYGEGKGTVTVELDGNKKSVICKNGKWLAELEPMEYGGPYTLTISCDEEKIILENIYIGEVYLCAGQSNMQFKLGESTLPKEEYKSNSMLRLYSTSRLKEGEHFTPEDKWVVCDKATAEFWTAIGYGIGQEITTKKDVAVGIIACYQGASVIESWVPKGAFEERGIAVERELLHPDHTWINFIEFNPDGTLYNYALSQVTPFSISSIIWYQGESNAKREDALNYAERLCELIRIWRNDFKDEKLPFIIVQIADFLDARYKDGWSLIQKAQLKVPDMINDVKTVVSRDICENDEIHPPTKHRLAKRISEALL